jgi:endonuclease/exonuclease/phosphatase family metal-dependent hydrolase
MAYGLGPAAAHTAHLDAVAVYDRLDYIVETIAASGADMVLLQEVDFASQRSHNIDQLHYIAAALGWGFAARAITWECRYLPRPFWKPWRHAGRLRAGQGAISRYPLIQNSRQRLSQSRAHPLWTPLFAPYHTIQMVEAVCGERTLRLFNVHLEAHDATTRARQAEELVTFVRPLLTPNSVVMGAFNSPVIMATEAEAVPDHTMVVIDSALRDRVRPATGTVPPAFGGVHVLVGPGLRTLDTEVVAVEAPVSDHLPLLVSLGWALPPAPPGGNHVYHGRAL